MEAGRVLSLRYQFEPLPPFPRPHGEGVCRTSHPVPAGSLPWKGATLFRPSKSTASGGCARPAARPASKWHSPTTTSGASATPFRGTSGLPKSWSGGGSIHPNSTQIHRILRSRNNALPTQLVAEYSYFDNGTVRSIKDAHGHHTRFYYNARGQLTHRWGAATSPAKFVFDDYGQQSAMHTFREGTWTSVNRVPSSFGTGASITSWTHDPASGLLTDKEDALGQGQEFTYDAALRLQDLKRARANTVITYAYVPQTGELSGKTYSDGTTPNVSFTYNRLGALRTASDVLGTRTYHYRATDQRLLRTDLPAAYGSGAAPHGDL